MLPSIIIYITISKFILEDGKLVSDEILSNKIPSNMNLKTVKLDG